MLFLPWSCLYPPRARARRCGGGGQSECRMRGGSSQALCCVMLTVCSRSQGILLCPQTLSQARRERLRRAFTDATSDTVTYVKTVGVYVHRLNPLCVPGPGLQQLQPLQPRLAQPHSCSSSTCLVISSCQ